jgi:hypothetical protein
VNCSNCGATIQPGNRFCTKCGANVQPNFQNRLVCACGNHVAPGSRFCPDCGATLQGQLSAGVATEPALPSLKGVWLNSRVLRWFGGLFIIAFLGKWLESPLKMNLLTHSIGTLLLMGAMTVLFVILRQPLAAMLQAIGRLPGLRPVWTVMASLPRPLRLLGGLAVPFILAYLMTPFLSGIFAGYGFMVNAVSVVINTVVAYFFFAKPPRGLAQ